MQNLVCFSAQISGKPVNWSMFPVLGNSAEETEAFADNIVDYAHPLNETIFDCRWREVEFCVGNFTPIISDSGVCFTFNDPVNKSEILKINQPGRQNGLHLTLDVLQDEYVSSEESAAGFKVCRCSMLPLLPEYEHSADLHITL